jgi:SprT protein
VPISPELDARLRERVGGCYAEASLAYKRPFVMPSIDFDLRGARCGMAYFIRNHLSFNGEIYARNIDATLADTVPHECAHLIALAVWGAKLGSGHGRAWRSTCRVLGMIDPQRCAIASDLDLTGVKIRRLPRTEYACKCGIPHMLTARKAASLHRYRCARCRSPLTLAPSVG